MLSLNDSTLRFRHSVRALVLFVAIGVASYAHAIDIFVDASIAQSGTGTGGFQNAKKTLQEALAIQDEDEPDTIRIARGTYFVADGVTSMPPDPRDLSYVLQIETVLIGGYPPGGGPESSRNVLTNEVILSGDRLKDDPTTEAGLAAIFDGQNFSLYADNVYSVVDCSGVSAATVLDSVTIRGGHADGPVSRGNGAGISAPNGTPTLRSCVVEFNRAKVTTAPSGSVTEPIDGAGGGLYATDGGALTIQDTTFRSNQALWGAGLFRGPLDEDPITAHVNLIGCRLERNRCFTSGVDGARPRGGGALFEINTGIIRIESCEFLHNTSDLSSDGLGGGSALVVAPPVLCESDCLEECFECAETCDYGSGTPPCMSMACPQCPTHVFVTNSLFAGNSTRGAGAAIKMNRKALFQDCTIAWNVRAGQCFGFSFTAGVLVGHKSHSELSNCILFDNQDLSDCGWSLLQEQISDDPGTGLSSSYAFQYSDVEGLCVSPCSPSSGNISAPPLFAATPDDGADNQWGTADDVFGDYTLGSGSLCADAGSDALLPQDDPFDLDRDGVTAEPLPVDVGYLTRRKEAGVGPVDQRVDMGAHELGCREDFNGDGTINGTDLAFTLSAWTGDTAHYLPCPSFVQEDLDRNCRVDGFDLSQLLGAWGPCGVSGLSGGGGGEAAASSGPAEASGCEGSYELFLQWVESGDWDAFLQWHQCFMQLSGGS